MELQLSPPVEAWESEGQNSYFGGGYRLSLEEQHEAAGSRMKVVLLRDDLQKFTLQDFQATWELTDPDLYAIWTYNHVPTQRQNFRALATESFGDLTTPNSGIPYVSAVSREGKNLLALGILSQNRIINLQGHPLESGGYQISLDTRLPFETDRFEEVIYTDTTPQNWFSATRSYADWVDQERGYTPFPVVQACYHPMYDLWYWALDDTNPGLYWTTLTRAKQLGFQSYLFDAGWESQPGELFKWLEGAVGNYTHPEDKLPGFPGFLQYVKDRLRMHVVLWMSPYAIGRNSMYYRKTSRSHILFERSNTEYNGGLDVSPMTLRLGRRYDENVNLCPRDSGTREHLKALFERVSTDYCPDGYWLDFQETIPFLCESFHSDEGDFGQGFNLTQDTIKQTVLSAVDRPTVELRFPVANLNNKPYANLWQSIDSPGDFDTMRLCSLMMRPFSRGVVMGTDEMYWRPDADPVTVGKFAATTVLSGVPAFGANFEDAPRSHSDIVRAWLRFYKNHQIGLTEGDFLPFGDFAFPNHRIESSDAAFVYLRKIEDAAEVPLAWQPEAIYLVNCTDQDAISVLLPNLQPGDYQLQVLNQFLKAISEQTVWLEGPATVRADVPQGGAAKLSRKP
ncbi:MAG: hypothetical protein L0312_16350 [Acidobacteria bacterium]|nr:hypothetical protein [Acidobacteriota bacterium]